MNGNPVRLGCRHSAGMQLPNSYGSVTLQSVDYTQHPLIDLKFDQNETDRIRLREGARLAWDLAHSELLTPFHRGAIDIDQSIIDDDHQLDAWIHATPTSMAHPTCTVRWALIQPLAPSSIARGAFEGLRVVDGSIMPTLIRASTNFTCMMIGGAHRRIDVLGALVGVNGGQRCLRARRLFLEFQQDTTAGELVPLRREWVSHCICRLVNSLAMRSRDIEALFLLSSAVTIVSPTSRKENRIFSCRGRSRSVNSGVCDEPSRPQNQLLIVSDWRRPSEPLLPPACGWLLSTPESAWRHWHFRFVEPTVCLVAQTG